MDARELVELMGEALDGVVAATAGLTDQDWAASTGCPGWTVKDVASHVIGIEQELLGDPAPDEALPDDLPHVRDEFSRWTERPVHARRGAAGHEVFAELRDTVSRRMTQLRALSDDDLAGDVPGPRGSQLPAFRLLGIRIFDVWAHEQDIRRALGRPGGLDGRAGAFVLRRMLSGTPGALGRAGLPSGRCVVIEVTGEQAGRVGVRLQDDAAVRIADDELGEVTPDARLLLDFAAFTPIVCGRADAPPVDSGGIKVEGDEDLARAVVSGLAMTP